MKAILYILLGIVLFFNIPNILIAQEVEDPSQVLVDNTWYLTKLIIEEQEYPFIPSQSLQNVNLNFNAESSNEEVSGLLTTEFYELASASFNLQGDEDLYTWDWGFMASMFDKSNYYKTYNDNNIATDYLYYDIFWMYDDRYSGQNEPYHHTYLINQSGSVKELIFTADNGNKAYFQNVELSVQDFEKDNLVLYPNPVSNELFIENSTQSVQLEIYDLSGRKLLHQEINNSTESVNVSQLSDGIYFYGLSQNGKRVKTGKLVKGVTGN